MNGYPVEQNLFDDLAEINGGDADVKKPDPVKDDVYEELKDIIGPEAADRLVDYYSGSGLYIPQSIAIKRKHGQIRDEFKKGASYRELARRYGFTERHIRNITKEQAK